VDRTIGSCVRLVRARGGPRDAGAGKQAERRACRAPPQSSGSS
jgi:hypothetical protein